MHSRTEKSNQVCIKEIKRFTKENGRAKQFEITRPILMGHLWQALIANFGYPVLACLTL